MLQISVAEHIARNYSKEFLKAKVNDHEILSLDYETVKVFLRAIKNDGELKSLLIRSLQAIKSKRLIVKQRIIPELEYLIESFEEE